jgi:hypothetical protein
VVPAVVRRADPSAVGSLLAGLPEWFGIPAANAQYLADAARLPSYLAVEVHTVGLSHEDAGCARTRAFYLAQGFVAMTELQRIDWNGPTLILVRPL